ncbi:MAG: hypothetical protein J6M18_06540 [Actinomycetaceae bacterium]|nr:hypothetical protein [Actinomycetaceae bacterium]
MLRIRALARMGLFFALGALMMGVIGFLLSWMAPTNWATGLPILLTIPGFIMLISAGVLVVTAAKLELHKWKLAYEKIGRGLIIAAIVCIAGIALVSALFFTTKNILPLLLIAAIALQGPLSLVYTGRKLRSIASINANAEDSTPENNKPSVTSETKKEEKANSDLA